MPTSSRKTRQNLTGGYNGKKRISGKSVDFMFFHYGGCGLRNISGQSKWVSAQNITENNDVFKGVNIFDKQSK